MDAQSRIRRALLLAIPGLLSARFVSAQNPFPGERQDTPPPEDVRLPSGKKQQDAILKADYEHNLKDVQELIGIANSFEEDLEKNEQYVLSLAQLKMLDDIEKLTKRIRGRLKRY